MGSSGFKLNFFLPTMAAAIPTMAAAIPTMAAAKPGTDLLVAVNQFWTDFDGSDGADLIQFAQTRSEEFPPGFISNFITEIGDGRNIEMKRVCKRERKRMERKNARVVKKHTRELNKEAEEEEKRKKEEEEKRKNDDKALAIANLARRDALVFQAYSVANKEHKATIDRSQRKKKAEAFITNTNQRVINSGKEILPKKPTPPSW